MDFRSFYIHITWYYNGLYNRGSNKMKTILGVDIGMNGCLSFYDGQELLCYPMPTYKVTGGNELDILRVADIIRTNAPTEAYIEKAMLMPVNGKKAYQKLGEAEGAFKGILCGLKIPYTIIRPQEWKKAMSCPADKDAARMRASQLLPQFAHNWDKKKDDGVAEASLIALFGFNK